MPINMTGEEAEDFSNSYPIKPDSETQKWKRGQRVICFHDERKFKAVINYTFCQKFWGTDESKYDVTDIDTGYSYAWVPEENIFPENAIRCPYCHKFSGIGMDFNYERHATRNAEVKTIGFERFCSECGQYISPANKWLEGKNAK